LNGQPSTRLLQLAVPTPEMPLHHIAVTPTIRRKNKRPNTESLTDDSTLGDVGTFDTCDQNKREVVGRLSVSCSPYSAAASGGTQGPRSAVHTVPDKVAAQSRGIIAELRTDHTNSSGFTRRADQITRSSCNDSGAKNARCRVKPWELEPTQREFNLD
jgi:hypothetical protein